MEHQKSFIPFLDLYKINRPYHERLKKKFSDFLEKGNYINGLHVKKFEESFADFCSVDYCIGVGNGLDALTLILKGYIVLNELNIGDEVIVAANTFVATILSIKQAGLKPILVEPDEDTFVLTPNCIQHHITNKTKAIVPTHLYGQLAPMDDITALAKKYKVLVISDAAQAHGAKTQDGRMAGGLSDASSFSFYPTKNLGAMGDAGAITTNNEKLAKIVRSISNYGFSKKYVSTYAGVNSRLDEIQASFLVEKLKDLENTNQVRRNIAKRYSAEIDNPKIRLPLWDGSEDHVFHLFVVRVQNRAHFCSYLDTCGIGYLIHYPVAPHQQKAFSEFSELVLPITEKIHKEVVSIPLNLGLGDADIDKIIMTLNQY